MPTAPSTACLNACCADKLERVKLTGIQCPSRSAPAPKPARQFVMGNLFPNPKHEIRNPSRRLVRCEFFRGPSAKPNDWRKAKKARTPSIFLIPAPPFYESSSSVKRERTVAAPVNLPFFYPSIGVSLAPVGCFEVALAAPSPNEPKGPGGCRARQYQHGITVAGSFLSFRGSGEPSYCAGPTATANSPEGVFIS